jgi:hypothetical protein
MAQLGYSPLPPNLVQEDFNAIGRMNGGQQPPPVSSSTCKNPYVDGQTHLPGEPSIIGQSAPPSPQPVGGSGPSSGSSGSKTGSGGKTVGSTGTTTPGTPGTGSNGTATNGSTGANGKSTATTVSGSTPQGNKGISAYLNHEKKKAAASGPNSYIRADDLREAATSALGFSSPAVEISSWCLVLVAAIFFPVLAVGRRRKRNSANQSTTSPTES